MFAYSAHIQTAATKATNTGYGLSLGASLLPAAIRIYQNQLTYEVDTGIIQFRRLLSFLEGAVFVLKLK